MIGIESTKRTKIRNNIGSLQTVKIVIVKNVKIKI